MKLLGIDIGGGSIRCIIYDTKNKNHTLIRQNMSDKTIFKIGDFGYGMDADEIIKYVVQAIDSCIIKSSSNKEDISALSLSVLRHTTVAIDKDGKVLYASPNRDARAVDATMKLNDSCADKIYQISGHKPMPNLMGCKLLWLKETSKELYDKIHTVFTLHDYIIYKLTGKIISEKTHAGESMLYDLKKNNWSDTLISELGLRRDMFPQIVLSGAEMGKVSSDASIIWGLSENTIVACGAGDTQSALLGLGALEIGEIGVAGGTTVPIQMLVDKPFIDDKGRLWTGIGALPDTYVIESNGGGMGMAVEWIAGLIYSENPNPVKALMASASKAKPGAGGAVSTIGADVFNNSVLALPIDQLFFSTTNHTPSKEDRNKVARAVVEGMAFAVRANVEQLKEVSGYSIDKLYVGGGLSRDLIFNSVISDAMGLPVVNPTEIEASAMGAVVCAAKGQGLYKSLVEASKDIVQHKEAVSNIVNSYERIYDDWKEMYFTSLEANMSLGALISELKSQDRENAIKGGEDKVSLKIYVDADLSKESVKMLEEFGTVEHKNYRDGDMLEGDEMIATLKNYDVFITEVDIVDANIIKELPNLRMIGVCRGNPTNIDIDACSAAGIPVVYTPGRNADAVADLTLGLMLSVIRMVPQSSQFLKEEGGEAGDMGRMGAAYFRYQGSELWKTTVGLIGGGAIGKKVARRLSGFDANILVYDPYLSSEDATLMGAQLVSLDYLLSNSDIISLHAPVTESTTNMINAEAFAKMKDGVYFINTARAALVDYNALLDALKSGKVKGAGLDVFPIEPPAWNDPLIQMENVLSTPHIAGNTLQVSMHQGIIMADNIKSLLRGEMTSDVINRKSLGSFSFTADKSVDSSALEKLTGKVFSVSDLEKSKEEKTSSVKPSDKVQPKAEKPAAPVVGGYMGLIKQFLIELQSDDEVKEKTKSKDISFQITFKDNDESCYMYFKGGEVLADLGVYPYGAAEVNLKMPIDIFDGMMKGTVNGAKAAMTGKMSFTGNVRKAMSMQSIMKLMMGAYQKAIDKVGNVDITSINAPKESKKTGYSSYMGLIKQFLTELSNDDEVKEKTKSKDISFMITFKDNDESCYMYFKGGEVIADLGAYPYGEAEVNLKMPIEIFDGMMKGTVNGAKAAMTGKMSFTGNVRKAMSMQSIMKLMMGAYQKAIEKIGNIDVANLEKAAEEAKTPVKTETQTVAREKKAGLFKKLFGKAESIDTQEQRVVYVGANTKPKTNDIRDVILEITNELYEKGLLTSIGGNISARCEDNPNHVWITPSSVFKGDLRADMMVKVDLDGNNVGDNELSASSEKCVHLAIYKIRPEIMSVVHSHAPKATLMALAGLKFLPISSDAAFIGDVPVVPFVIPGSPELGDMVADAIGAEGAAVLMQNHGLVVAGNSLRRAADTTEVIEITASKIIECHQLGITPALLPKEAQEELSSIGKMLV